VKFLSYVLIFNNFCACCLYGRGSVLPRPGDEISNGRCNFGGFLPPDNALYSIAFWTHTKTAELIEIPFGMMSRLGSTKYESIIVSEVGGGIAHRGRNLICTIALLCFSLFTPLCTFLSLCQLFI